MQTELTVRGHKVTLASEPPPHLLFLASQVQASADGSGPADQLALGGGLSSLLIKAIDGEPVEFEGGKLPRNITQLREAGAAFTMQVYEVFGSYEALAELFAATMGAIKGHGASANPT